MILNDHFKFKGIVLSVLSLCACPKKVIFYSTVLPPSTVLGGPKLKPKDRKLQLKPINQLIGAPLPNVQSIA